MMSLVSARAGGRAVPPRSRRPTSPARRDSIKRLRNVSRRGQEVARQLPDFAREALKLRVWVLVLEPGWTWVSRLTAERQGGYLFLRVCTVNYSQTLCRI